MKAKTKPKTADELREEFLRLEQQRSRKELEEEINKLLWFLRDELEWSYSVRNEKDAQAHFQIEGQEFTLFFNDVQTAVTMNGQNVAFPQTNEKDYQLKFITLLARYVREALPQRK